MRYLKLVTALVAAIFALSAHAAQRNVTQIRDVTSTVAGTVTFPASGYYDAHRCSSVLVQVVVATAASGALAISTKAEEGTDLPIFDTTAIAIGNYWGLSIGQDTMLGTADNGLFMMVVPRWVKVTATGGATGTVRLVVWCVQITG